MKKKHFAVTAAVLCGTFLVCQFLLHHRTVFTSVSACTVTCADWKYSIGRLQLMIPLKTYALVLL